MNISYSFQSLLNNFIKSDISKGIILIISCLIAIILSNNTLTAGIYHSFLSKTIQINIGNIHFNKNIRLWINDALMVLFFMMISLEVKREFIKGELVGRERIILPLVAALGGMIIPSLIFIILNYSNEVSRKGWAIPTATDVAFSLGILLLLGKRVPTSLKTFLMALAIIDDLGAILIIMLFYATNISFSSLIIVITLIIFLLFLNYCNIYYLPIYLFFGILLWIFMSKSGIHPTLSGVIIGFLVPLKEKNGYSPANSLLFILMPWVNWLILPLFAFVNTGISLSHIKFSEMISSESLGIILGLLIGKPLGISIFSWIGVKLRLVLLPYNIKIYDIIAISVLCGIGFTMSTFISSLAYPLHEDLVNLSKIGILSGSLLSAIIGYMLLRMTLNKDNKDKV